MHWYDRSITSILFVNFFLNETQCIIPYNFTISQNWHKCNDFVVTVLSVGYSCGLVLLCDVENSAQLHTIEFECGVASLKWISETSGDVTAKGNNRQQSESESQQVDCFQECAATYLPKLPNFPKT